jgi:hypothetical protein
MPHRPLQPLHPQDRLTLFVALGLIVEAVKKVLFQRQRSHHFARS